MSLLKLASLFECLSIKHSGGCLFYCEDDNTVLLVLRSKIMPSPLTWSFPGGQPKEDDEDSNATAIREATEELNTIPTHKTIFGKHLIAYKEYRYDVYVYKITAKEKEKWTKKIKLDEENQDFKWFPINKLPTKTHMDMAWIPSELS